MPAYLGAGPGEMAYGHIIKEAIRKEKEVRITIRDGDTLFGILRREDKHTVTLETERSYLIIFKNQIARIDLEPGFEPDVPEDISP